MWFRGEDNRETCQTKGPGLGRQRSKSDDDEEDVNPDKTTEGKALKTMKFLLSVSRHWTPFSTNENDSNSMLKEFDILSNTSPNELRLCSGASANKTEQKIPEKLHLREEISPETALWFASKDQFLSREYALWFPCFGYTGSSLDHRFFERRNDISGLSEGRRFEVVRKKLNLRSDVPLCGR